MCGQASGSAASAASSSVLVEGDALVTANADKAACSPTRLARAPAVNGKREAISAAVRARVFAPDAASPSKLSTRQEYLRAIAQAPWSRPSPWRAPLDACGRQPRVVLGGVL